MKTVWKYPISLEGFQEIEMPKGAEILKFHKQGSRQEDEAYIWCLVDTDSPREKRQFFLLATGMEIPAQKYKYLGTLWLMNGTFVLHLFEVLK